MSFSGAFSRGNEHIPRPGPTLGGFLGEAVLSSVPVGTAAHHYGPFAVNGWHFDDFQVRSPRAVAYFMAGSLFPAKQPGALYGVAGPGCHQCAQVALLPRRHPCGVWAGCPVTRWPCSQQSWRLITGAVCHALCPLPSRWRKEDGTARFFRW